MNEDKKQDSQIDIPKISATFQCFVCPDNTLLIYCLVVSNVALNQIETDRWIKQYGDVLFKVIVAQSKYIKLL